MKQNKLLKSIIIFVFAIGISFTVKSQGIDLSGNWKRNTEACDPGDLSINSIATELKIAQDAQKLTIERTSISGKGEVQKENQVLKLDGSITRIPFTNDQTKKSSVKWASDRQSLTELVSYVDAQDKEVRNSKKTWILSADGKTLHITAVIVIDGETHQLEEYFLKQ